MNPFVPLCAHEDIDLHPSPEGPWQRIVVLGGWTSKEVLRKRWPHAAAVGPLRTLAGIDLLVRNLLANPCVRLVVWDGPSLVDVLTGKKAWPTLETLWKAGSATDAFELAPELKQPFDDLVRHAVDLVDIPAKDFLLELEPYQLTDREGGAIALPPPVPKVDAAAPHGDPGERVTGETLADVWPQALHRILRFGRDVQGGKDLTRELLNLVSIVRDPKATIASFSVSHDVPEDDASNDDKIPHPNLGLTWEAVRSYTKQLTDTCIPEGAEYSYGSRMRGAESAPTEMLCQHGCGSWPPGTTICPDCNRGLSACTTSVAAPVDQFEVVRALLVASPGTRAAVLTPWMPELDSGKESGRPCLVEVMFRAVPHEGRAIVEAMQKGDPEARLLQFVADTTGQGGPTQVLHMTVVFRSHDVFAGYPLNLTACCLWLSWWARELKMAVGTLTCVSQSAHIYERDWNAAQAKVDGTMGPAVRWDVRSTWRVEAFFVGTLGWACPECGEWYAETVESAHCGRIGCVVERKEGTPKKREVRHLRALATAPGTNRVIGVFEHASPSGLRMLVERSGLITEMGQALWLGAEIERLAGVGRS